MRTIALDLGARKICYSEVEAGEETRRRTVRRLGELEPLLGPDTPPARVAIEACREAWAVCAKLKEWGKEPVLVDTTRVGRLGVGYHGRKTDELDAKVLAMALYENHIPKAHLLSLERQKLRSLLAVRSSLVDTMTALINAIRGHAVAAGSPLPSMSTTTFCVRVAGMKLTETLKALVMPLLTVLSETHHQLCELESQLESVVHADQSIWRLMSVPGVGPVVAATFISVIDDAGRFSNAHQVMCYLGLVPREDTTGGKRRLGGISKAGNPYARAMLIQAAHVLLTAGGHDPLREWGLSLAERKGRPKAVVAVARRLAGLLWAMSRDGACYNPKRVGKASADGLRRQALRAEVDASAMELVAAKAAKRQVRLMRASKHASDAVTAVKAVSLSKETAVVEKLTTPRPRKAAPLTKAHTAKAFA